MGLHFIKNGTKHDVCVKRPSLFPASATTYDNSQSGLSATRVQGAIDEVNAKVDRGSVSVTADGVKTYAQLLAELYALIDFTKFSQLTAKMVRKDNGSNLYTLPCNYYLPTYNHVQFSGNNVLYNNALYVNTFSFKVQDDLFTYKEHVNGSLSDYSSSVPTSGVMLSIYY